MVFPYIHQRPNSALRERREILQHQQPYNPELYKPQSPETFHLSPKCEALLVHAYTLDHDITREELQTFAMQREAQDREQGIAASDPDIVQIVQWFKELTNEPIADLPVREHIETNIQKTLAFLHQKQHIRRETMKELEMHKREFSNVPPPVETALSTVKNTLGSFNDAFWNADGKDQAIMAVGALGATMAIVGLYRGLMKHKGEDGAMGALAKSTSILLKGGLLVGVGWTAVEAANRTYEKTYGRPLIQFSRDNVPLMPSKEEWQASTHLEKMENAWEQMESMQILTDDTFPELAKDRTGNLKYALGLNNLSLMSITDLSYLYETGVSQSFQILHTQVPQRPFNKDHLSDTERFNLVEMMMRSLKLIDDKRVPTTLMQTMTTEEWNMRYAEYVLHQVEFN